MRRHLGAADLLGRRQGRAFHRLGMRQQRLADLGQLVAFARTVEQRRAQLVLETVDAARHRGVLDVQPARCSGQGAGSGQLQEESQVGPFRQRIHECAFWIAC